MKRERPAQDELQAATMWLKKELHAASLDVVPEDGTYVITATTVGGGTGAYELTIKQFDCRGGRGVTLAVHFTYR